ncbi:MAG: DJ-1/PfpI family protein [Alphaproteobacteria bacterium]|jgi:protease I|nr:DJ-1/PfpI family protein [Alphaproteobacteria bacterium]
MQIQSSKSDALSLAENTGIELVRHDDGFVAWAGEYGGNNKPRGPLAGQRVGVIVASEFSDFQAYYLASYIGELGGICEFLLVDWVKWKYVRPNLEGKGVRGQWDLKVDPIPVVGGDKNAAWKSLIDARAADYDVVIVIGGHSADVMVTETPVHEFLRDCAQNSAVIGAIGAGSMPLIRAGIMHGKRCTGDRTVDYMLKKIANFEDVRVVTDANLITARATIDTPEFLRALCRAVDPSFKDGWRGRLKGKKVLLPVSDDFEDIELIVPTMELLHRGAEIIIGRFAGEFKSRPGLIGVDVLHGNFGTTIPFQEIPDDEYVLKDLADVAMSEFDLALITGAFNPWNMVVTGVSDWLAEAMSAGKLIASICHGPIALSAANLVDGKRLTGWEASRDSVEIMGGVFNCQEWAAAIDGNIVTGRSPAEVPELVDAISVALS